MKIVKICKSNKGVSEILGTVLLLGIAVAIFSVLYFIVLSEPLDASEPYPIIVSYVEGQNLIIEHRGGEELGINTRFNMTIGGESIPVILSQDLEDSNSDGKWNFGERIIKDIGNSFSLTNSTAGIFGVDDKSNRAIFSGDLNIFPENDIGVEMKIDNEEPRVGDYINITLIAHNYRGDIDATGIKINFIIPDGLKYENHTFITSDGSEYTDDATSDYHYDNETGIWDIDHIIVRDLVSLKIKVLVIGTNVVREPTQLAIILDGSSSITSDDWDLMTAGLSNAILNSSIFPHDGSVELTIIQFGERDPPRAQLEIGPIIVNETNYVGIGANILSIDQMVDIWWSRLYGWQRLGYTPMDCGIRLTTDVLAGIHPDGSILFDEDFRKVINLVTDGKPNCQWIPGTYTATYSNDYTGKISAENARAYLLDALEMDENKDEFDSLAVGNGPEMDWLMNNIVWPQPGYEAPPYDQGAGWVNHTVSWEDFESAISEMFRVQFSAIKTTVQIAGLDSKDPYQENDIYTVKILPTD